MRLFYSYSQRDQRRRARLEAHLAPLQREGLLDQWHDRCIVPIKHEHIEALICVGGDGTLHAAGKLAEAGVRMVCAPKTIDNVVNGYNQVSASLAFRVARLAGVMVDDLLVGKFLPPGACPNCGHVAVPDFADDSTVVEDIPRPTSSSGLAMVR